MTVSRFSGQSCHVVRKIALNRWIRTEIRWNTQLASLSSPDWWEILRPRFHRKSGAQSLNALGVSMATGWRPYVLLQTVFFMLYL